MLTKLKRFMNPRPIRCPYCRDKASLGQTEWGLLGCSTCQGKVDRFIAENYKFEVQK